LQKSFGEAVRQQNLRVAGYPRFESQQAGEGSEQVQFSATFEVYPEIALGDLSAWRSTARWCRWAMPRLRRPSRFCASSGCITTK